MRSKPQGTQHEEAQAKPEAEAAETSFPALSVYKLHRYAKLPERAHFTDVGFDVFAHLLTESGRAISRAVHQRGCTLIETALVVKAPPGYYIKVCSRSGLALRGIFVANSPGIIDPNYTGELKIILFNGSHETQYIQHGHRIAQLVLAPLPRFRIEELHEAPTSTERGPAGFGSTGL